MTIEFSSETVLPPMDAVGMENIEQVFATMPMPSESDRDTVRIKVEKIDS